MWRFSGRMWQKTLQVKKKIRVRERHILPRNVTNVTRHIFCHRKKWQMWRHSPTSETGSWEEIWLRPTLWVWLWHDSIIHDHVSFTYAISIDSHMPYLRTHICVYECEWHDSRICVYECEWHAPLMRNNVSLTYAMSTDSHMPYLRTHICVYECEWHDSRICDDVSLTYTISMNSKMPYQRTHICHINSPEKKKWVLPHVWMRHGFLKFFRYGSVKLRMWVSSGTHICQHASRNEWVMSTIWIESCHTHRQIMSHTWMSHLTRCSATVEGGKDT